MNQGFISECSLTKPFLFAVFVLRYTQTMNFKPQTGDKFHFTQTGNTARLGAQTEDGFEARYVDGPSKGMQVVLSERFLVVAGVMV